MTRAPAVVVAGALVALATITAGCGSGSPGAGPSGGTPSDGSSTGRSPSAATASSPSTGPLALHPTTKVRVPGSVGPVRLGDDEVVFPFSDGSDDSWREVGVAGFDDSRPRVVAKSAWPHGLINWVAATGDWVAYVDQSAEQSDSSPDVRWRIRAVDTRTGETVQLASNGDEPDPYVPIVLGQDGWFFWTSAESDRSARESVWKPGWGAPKDLLRHTEMTPGSETLAGDRLVYLGAAATGARGHTVGGDCWSVPITGGDPAPLTHTALAMGCAAAGDDVVWTQHIEQNPKRMPALGILDDPYTVWSQPLDGGRPTLLNRGYILSSPALAGDGFASWDPDGRRVVRSLTSTKEVRLPPGRYAVGSAAAGRRLAYATVGNGGTTIHVDEVSGG
ncbi:hypothetical protein [Nocardioides sp. KR10-350]|uniref:hypothetical protein n=1 Tax=Nocardioides cheoyonin TaxID=3156615 RepID=UPI0032B5F950